MKKIMFNKRYGLEQAVLLKTKIQTRRIVPNGTPLGCWKETEKKAKYKVGDVVAVAQSYKDAGINFLPEEDEEFGCHNFPAEQTAGWANKMFVRADLMTHQIHITDVRVERLQEISDEDCMAEGISFYKYNGKVHYTFDDTVKKTFCKFDTPREAYTTLINKISGRCTWESNPWVFVYTFELVK